MSKEYHDVGSVAHTAEVLRNLSDRAAQLAEEMKRAGVKKPGLHVNHERDREKALDGMQDWIDDGEKKLRLWIRKHKK